MVISGTTSCVRTQSSIDDFCLKTCNVSMIGVNVYNCNAVTTDQAYQNNGLHQSDET